MDESHKLLVIKSKTCIHNRVPPHWTQSRHLHSRMLWKMVHFPIVFFFEIAVAKKVISNSTEPAVPKYLSNKNSVKMSGFRHFCKTNNSYFSLLMDLMWRCLTMRHIFYNFAPRFSSKTCFFLRQSARRKTLPGDLQNVKKCPTRPLMSPKMGSKPTNLIRDEKYPIHRNILNTWECHGSSQPRTDAAILLRTPSCGQVR